MRLEGWPRVSALRALTPVFAGYAAILRDGRAKSAASSELVNLSRGFR